MEKKHGKKKREVSGKKNFDALRAKGKSHTIEATGEKLRAMMLWIAKNKLVDKKAN